jgi:hypothetical protein
MSTLAALLVATPIFGLSLEVDPSLAMTPAATAPMTAALSTGDAGGGDPASEAEPTNAELMQMRGRMAPIHKWFGIATWVSMTATLFFGWIQYYNLYGMGAGRDDNPCVQGDAVFGQGQCTGTPIPHLTTAILTTALYSVTFGLSFRMPDPLDLDEGDGDYAKNLRRHKRLRWVHLAGMIAQMGLGLIIANGSRLGLDRTNDYGTLQALSTVHLGIGMVTWGALSWAAAAMIF